MFNIKLFRMRNSLSGNRVFILGNGPSIKNHNLNLLKGEYTIGVNASPLLEEKYGFQAKYYCLSDPRFLANETKKEIAFKKFNSKCYVFCRDNFKTLISQSNNIYKADFFFLPSRGRDGFSRNLLSGFYFGCSTTYLAIQLAFHLGFKDTYILGLDLNYGFGKYERFYFETSPQETDYLCSVQLWNYLLARKSFEAVGRKLWLCNKESWATPYIPYENFNNLF